MKTLKTATAQGIDLELLIKQISDLAIVQSLLSDHQDLQNSCDGILSMLGDIRDQIDPVEIDIMNIADCTKCDYCAEIPADEQRHHLDGWAFNTPYELERGGDCTCFVKCPICGTIFQTYNDNPTEIKIKIFGEVETVVKLRDGETIEDVLNRDCDIYLHNGLDGVDRDKEDLGYYSIGQIRHKNYRYV